VLPFGMLIVGSTEFSRMSSTPMINLYFQLLLLIGLTLGLIFAKKKRLVPHGWLMLILFLLNVASILVVMVPVAYVLMTRFAFTSFSLITVLHVLLGVTVMLLSLRILVIWRFRKPGASCYALKREMMRLYLLWVAEVLIGLALFYQLYL
jgi:hypothetical protein